MRNTLNIRLPGDAFLMTEISDEEGIRIYKESSSQVVSLPTINELLEHQHLIEETIITNLRFKSANLSSGPDLAEEPKRTRQGGDPDPVSRQRLEEGD
jgi:hypothetical protein